MPATASVFTEGELAYLHGQRRLARVATVGKDGPRTSCRSAGPIAASTTRST
jgi:hypothetical protein